MMKKNIIGIFLLAVILAGCSTPQNEPTKTALTYWNNGEVKIAIQSFVKSVSDKASPNYVKPEDRVAVFDNDGTLWCEKPLYIPVELEIAFIKQEYPNKPAWKEDALYSGVYNDDLSVLKNYSSMELINKLFGAHSGQKEEDYKQFVYKSLSTIKDRKFNRPLKEMTYAPMVELVHYLQQHDFKVFIVTGGELTSVRTVSEEIYNIPKENVVGSSVKYKYVTGTDGKYIVRSAKISSANDKHIKPTNIELHIGRKPIFAAGNSDGDYEMMEYTLSGSGPSLAILVNHDDEAREYSYMHGTEKAVEDAPKQGWKVVSMKNDFKIVFEEK